MSKEPKNQELKHHEPKSHEPKTEETKDHETKSIELKPQESKKPANLRANAMPVDGFVLSVDGKLKTRYASATDALAAGAKLKQTYPVIQIAVYDASERKYLPVGAQEN